MMCVESKKPDRENNFLEYLEGSIFVVNDDIHIMDQGIDY